MWDREVYLEIFNVFDQPNIDTPKQKYIIFQGFVQGIVFSDKSCQEKIEKLKDIVSAFKESINNEYKEILNTGEIEKGIGIDEVEPIRLTPSDEEDMSDKGDEMEEWYNSALKDFNDKYKE